MANKRNEDSRIKVLACIESDKKVRGNSPSIREISKKTGIKSTSHVAKLIDEMVAAGYLTHIDGCTRSLCLALPGELYLRSKMPAPEPVQMRSVNYINDAANICATKLRKRIHISLLGRTVAGEAVTIPVSDLGVFNPDETLSIFEDTLPQKVKPEDLFALEVEGSSMIEANINSGDLIILKKAETANPGDMVVVWIDDTNETTLKYFFPEEDGIRLQPANPSMKPIFISRNRKLRIIGQVIQVVRSMVQ